MTFPYITKKLSQKRSIQMHAELEYDITPFVLQCSSIAFERKYSILFVIEDILIRILPHGLVYGMVCYGQI